MPKNISVLCVHGVGHGDVDPNLEGAWTQAISDGLAEWNPELRDIVSYDFLKFDPLFDKAAINPVTYGRALADLLASGIAHGAVYPFSGTRGLFDIPDTMRWTAGMVAQWVSDEELRDDARNFLMTKIQSGNYDVVCAHSLGSLICYDTFLRNPAALQDTYFVSLGSQIGNPFVRETFAGRLEPLTGATKWFHLFNPVDHVCTAEIRLSADNFEEVGTEFDIPNDILNHNAVWYLNHQNTRARAWREISGTKAPKSLATSMKSFHALGDKPTRRALLVGINDYPDPANRLEGCVNDVFLTSSVLQECGFAPEDIRVVLNDRATATGVLDRLHWLLDGVRAGDERVLFYSGHGAQIPSYGSSEEVDHLDECLVPYDFDWTQEHAVTDKQFLNLYSQLPYDCYFVAIFDCCHSGGMTREGGRKVRGLTPPDDIRHRALRWNIKLQMWEDRKLSCPNPSLKENKEGRNYLGVSGASHRIGRAIDLRTMPQKEYNAVRKALKHNGPYLPVILEACQEGQLSYEYRHGVQSYGAFTFSLAAALRDPHSKTKKPTFIQLMDSVSARLRQLQYDQTPNLVGAKTILNQPVPWTRKTASSTGKKKAAD